MSFDRNKQHFFPLIFHALPYWIWTVFFLGAVFVALTLMLRQHDVAKAQTLLSYLQSSCQKGGATALQISHTAAGVGGSFLRLEGPDQHLIALSNESWRKNQQSLPDFTSFPVSAHRVWDSLQADEKKLGPWTVASVALANGAILQVGIDSSESLVLLYNIGLYLLLALPFVLVLCLLPAWLNLRRTTQTTRILTRQIIDLTNGITDRNKQVYSLGGDEAALVQAVQQQMTRHQRLTLELREAMDHVAHDLRTPMTRLRSIAEYGLRKADDKEHLQEALVDCLEESDRLLSMLNTMLSVAEAESDTVQLDLQPVLVEESIETVLDLYSILAEEQGVSITFTPEPGLKILADKPRICQVWANLIDNAIKYNGKEIKISSQQQGTMVAVQISDNGIGISETEINRIWERLFRGDRSRSKFGLGLGLTLVRAMVKNHHGTIEVSSTLNKGTTFTVSLPLAPEVPAV
jgi:signal transduction histidine kinase